MEKDCGAWINLLSHKVKARLNVMLQDMGITAVQSRVIYYILVHCKEGPVFQRDIENAFSLSRSTTTGILQLLEKNGIIRRESVASDARLKSLVPTEHAVRLNAQVADCLREMDRITTCGLSEEAGSAVQGDGCSDKQFKRLGSLHGAASFHPTRYITA